MSDSELKEKEQDAVLEDLAADFSPEEKAEFGKLADNDPEPPDDQAGGGYRPGGARNRFLARFSGRQKAAGGGITGIVIGIIFAIFGFLQGPGQFIHFAQLLQKFHFSNNEELGNGRTYRYFRSWSSDGRGHAKMQTRLGVIGNKIANNMEIKLQKQGLRSVYDRTTGNLIGYQYLEDAGSRTRAVNLIADAGLDPNLEIDTKRASEVAGFGRDSKGKPIGAGDIIDVKTIDGKRSLNSRRKFSKAITKSLGLGKLASAVGFRSTARRNGTPLHPLGRLDRKTDELSTDFARRIKEALREKFKNGTQPPGDVKLSNDKEPGPSGDAETEGRSAQAEAKADPTAAKSKLVSKFAIGGSVVGVLCAARQISNNIEKVKYTNIILPLIRIGTHTVAVGNQVMNGKGASMEELGVLNNDLYDAEQKLGWTSARSIQAELGEPQTGPDISPNAKPSKAGEKPAILNIIDSIFGAVGPGGSAACSTIGQTLIDAVSGQLILGIVTDIVSRLASSAGVNPIDAFAGWIVDVLAGEEVNVDAKGPDLGNLANYGARLAANDQALSMGGAKLTDAEVAQLDTESQDVLRNEIKQKSFFARIFDLNETSSLASKAIYENNNFASMQSFTSSTAQSSLNIVPNVMNSFSKLFTPKAHAAIGGYDYGFDEYGFSLDLQEDARFEDPYENALIVESQLEKLNSDYGSCFTMKVDPATFKLETKSTDSYEEPPSMCNDASNTSLLRYRFYLADSVLGNALACYEADDVEACANSGFGNSSSTSSSITAPAQEGLESHPALGPEISSGYFRLPDAVNGEYEFLGNTPINDRCGSKTLVDVVYTVAKRWYAKYPNSKLRVGDLNASGHASHKTGVDVDIFTVDRSATDTSGDAAKSLELAKMFADTGVIKVIGYSDNSVIADFNAYAKSKNLPAAMVNWSGHQDHFHVRIADSYKIPQTVGCP